MNWSVRFTKSARENLQDIREYIGFYLKEPVTAKNQINRIRDAIASLDQLPERFRICDAEPWQSRGLRVMPVDNYLVFYLPVESEATVFIMRIMYGGRNIEQQLEIIDYPVSLN